MKKLIAAGVMLGVVFLAAACGGSVDTRRDVARLEAAEIVARCSWGATQATVDPMTGKGMTQERCHEGSLTHLTRSLWRVRVSSPPDMGGSAMCQTFDAARYSPGNRAGQAPMAGC
jgi:hypothetical protein